MYPQYQASAEAWSEISRNSLTDMCEKPYKSALGAQHSGRKNLSCVLVSIYQGQGQGPRKIA
eukprot:scaffold318872_cov33-Tisochrysis_lutea.AAC.4